MDAALRRPDASDEQPPIAQLTSQDPTHIASRYQVLTLLGRGGMASAYRVRDSVTGQEVALKLLTVARDAPKAARTIELFEGEFHTLNQLAHPRVVRAFDYGVADGQPYYTMEILDGGDLHELAPLPWQEVCNIAYEICSVLSLLHSRRLVHRDLTPRNVRRTADGRAKLIDFGLLAPMGPTGLMAGTPPYVAPELVQSMTLDGRSDLFSLGATLYHALTGRTAFPARRFDQLRDMWRSSPLPPSRAVPGIPPAVDELVLALMRIDLGSRPKSAAEVMDRLLPLMAAPPDAELATARAFLTAPQLIGRDDVVIQFRKQMAQTLRSHGHGFLLSGLPGSGRSRMLDTFVLEAKLVGATTARAGAADAATGTFGVAAALTAQLCAAVPALAFEVAQQDPQLQALLFEPTAPEAQGAAANTNAPSDRAAYRPRDLSEQTIDRAALHGPLRNWLLGIARRKPVALAVDDVDRIDDASAAWLASLAWQAREHRLVYAATVTQASSADAPRAVAGLSVLQEQATVIELRPLQPEETTRLLGSVFGDVPNLQAISTALHALSGGRPKDCMSFAQSLVDQGAISAVGGTWVLPPQLDAGLLPSGLEESLERGVTALSPLARRILLLLALDVRGRLSRASLRGLDGMDGRELDVALDELRAAQIITGSLTNYALCHSAIARVVVAKAGVEQQLACQRELARIHEQADDHPVAIGFHWLQTETPAVGLDMLLARAQDADARTDLAVGGVKSLSGTTAARTFERALDVAEQLARPRREQQALWMILAGMTARGEDRHYYQRIPAAWLEQLKHDSGYDDFCSLDPTLEPLARLGAAFNAASARFAATPEAERVQSPPDAIKQLVAYVVCTIAVSVQALDCEQQAGLPELLVPFTPLSPMVRAMLGNAQGTYLNGIGQHEAARSAFCEALAAFETVPVSELRYGAAVRASIMQTVAEIDASLGVRTTYTTRLEDPDQDANQAVGAMYIRKVLAMQQGDWEAAERHRQGAELLLLQGVDKPMFSTLGHELEAHALARDLTGLKQVQTGLRAQADAYPSWKPVMHVADAHFARVCGDLAGALQAARTARELCGVGRVRSRWAIVAATLEVEVLTELGQLDAAQELGVSLLTTCERDGMRSYARSIACALALAEVQLGAATAALERVKAVIAEQRSLEISGLLLGRSYECAARIGIHSKNVEVLELYASLAAEQYRAGQTSVLGALYERILEDARSAGLIEGVALDAQGRAEVLRAASSWSRISTAMDGCEDSGERAQRALAVLCTGKVLNRGHLFLFTRDGLSLIASNIACPQSRELTVFVRDYLESEIEASDLTQTSGEFDTLDTDSRPGVWKDQDGTEYHSLILRADVDAESRVVGIAMLTGLDESDRTGLLSLGTALAKKLVESGDYYSAA